MGTAHRLAGRGGQVHVVALARLAALVLMVITEQQAGKSIQKDNSKKLRTIRKMFIKTDNKEVAGKEEQKCRSDFQYLTFIRKKCLY